MTYPAGTAIATQYSLPGTIALAYDSDGCYRLVLEMLRRAAMEARWSGYCKSARLFIAGDDCAVWCHLIGLDIETMRLGAGYFRQNSLPTADNKKCEEELSRDE